MNGKPDLISLNQDLMIQGKLYIHTKEYNEYIFSNYPSLTRVEQEHIFFIVGDDFKPIYIDKEAVLMFIDLKLHSTINGSGIIYTFLYGKQLIEFFCDDVHLMLIFERVF